jgi:hypothetical protein
MLWLFLSWGIDYRIKSSKTKFGRITSWTYDHPISHCVAAAWSWKLMVCGNLLELFRIAFISRQHGKMAKAFHFAI